MVVAVVVVVTAGAVTVAVTVEGVGTVIVEVTVEVSSANIFTLFFFKYNSILHCWQNSSTMVG